MPASPRHRAVESRLRQLIADAELPPPDDVEYLRTSVIFRWQGPRLRSSSISTTIPDVDVAQTVLP